MLTKSEIARAVEAIRSLSDVIEKLHKSTWPDAADSDILRKADLDLPRANDAGEAAARVLAQLEDAKRRVERLEAAKDYDAQHRKTFPRDEVKR
jgi:hypothetical protein